MSRPVRRNYPRRGLSIEDFPEDFSVENARPGRSRLPRYVQGEPAISERSLSGSRSRPSSKHSLGRPTYTRERSRGRDSDQTDSRNPSRDPSRSRIPKLVVRNQHEHQQHPPPPASSFGHESSRFIATPSPAVVSPEPESITGSDPDASYGSPAPFLSPMVPNFGMYRTHRSIGSSQPIPSSWGSGPEQYNVGVVDTLSIDSSSSSTETESESDSDSESHASNSHETEKELGSQPSLARQASVVKMARPSITDIRGNEKPAPKSSWLTSQDTLPQTRMGRPNVLSYLESETVPSVPGTAQAFGNGFLESTTTDTVSSIAAPTPVRPHPQNKASYADGRKSPRPLMPSTFESRHEKILGRDVPSGPLHSVTKEEDETLAELPMPSRIIKPHSNIQQSPPVRASTTSLPDLIRRATNLAAALEKGRPASRLKRGTVGFTQSIKEESDSAEDLEKPKRSSDELSDMLASFPTPSKGKTTPGGKRMSGAGSGALGDESRSARRSKRHSKPLPGSDRARCCGLPRWLFLLALLIALIIIAIAIVVPLQLVVLNKSSNSAAPVTTTNQNQTNTPCTLTCQNGGTLNTGACTCSCIGGFVGDTCAVSGNPSCQASDPNGVSYKNATVGSALPRIFDQSKSQFNMSLDVNSIFQEFARKNLSCTLENTLVSFNGFTAPTTRRRQRRQIAPRAPAYVTVTVGPDGGAPTPTGTATYSAPTAQSTTKVPQRAVDFCRSAVLFILELSGFDVATSAQSLMQAYMLQDTYPSPLKIGEYYTIDFKSLSVTTQNGTVAGGKGSG